MLDPVTGNPHTAHTTNPVPFITSFPLKQEGGCLADVAPTVLAVMVSRTASFGHGLGGLIRDAYVSQGLPQPEAMTGKSLLAEQ